VLRHVASVALYGMLLLQELQMIQITQRVKLL
jgi:hypothetical protein